MHGSSSAQEPNQVCGMTWRFAGPTSGTVARAYSLLDSPRDRLATVCRLRNNVVDVLREPVKITEELHEPGRLVTAAAQIKFSCCWQAVGSADSATGRFHKALPGHHDCVLTALAHVFAGVGSCSEFCVARSSILSHVRALSACPTPAGRAGQGCTTQSSRPSPAGETHDSR